MRRLRCPLRVRIVAGFTAVAFMLVFVFPGCHPQQAATPPPPPPSRPAQAAPAQTPQQLDEQLGRLQQAVDSIDKTAFDVPALAASLGPDAEKLFAFVRDQIAYEVYPGVLRGAKGTLIGRAGNALDKSLLLAELLKANHFTVQFASCTLDDASAQSLVDQMTLPGPERPPRASDDASLQALEASREVEAEQAATYRAVRQRMDGIAEQAVKDSDAIQQRLADSHITLGRDAPQVRRELVAVARQHTWVQYRRGEEWVDLDPSRLGQKPGERIAPPASTVPELPASLAQKVTIRVRVEQQAHGALSRWTALETVQPAADLAGAELRFFNVPGGLGQDGSLAAARKATRFMPELVVRGTTISKNGFDLQGNAIPASVFAPQPNATAGGFAAAAGALGGLGGDSGRASDSTSGGTTVPGGSLTGEWLEFEVSGPGAPAKSYVREIVDRIGVEARSAPGAKSLKPEFQEAGRVAISLLGERRILVEPGFLNEPFAQNTLVSPLLAKKDVLHAAFGQKLAKTPNGLDASTFEDAFKSDLSPELASLSLGIRAFGASQAAARYPGAVFYHASPAIFVYETTLEPRADGTTAERRGFDIVDDTLRVVAPPGAASAAPLALTIGVYQTHLERALALDFARLIQQQIAAEATGRSEIDAIGPPTSAIDIFAAADTAQIASAIVGEKGASGLAALDVPPAARARIGGDVAQGSLVISPQRPVILNGEPAVGWWRIDRATGNAVGMMDTGKGQGATETAVLEGNTVDRTAAVLRFAQSLCIAAGYLFQALLYVSLLLLFTRIAANPAAAPQQIAKFIKDFLSLGNILLMVGAYVACRAVNLKMEAFSEGEPGGGPGKGPSDKPGKGGSGPEKPGSSPKTPGGGPEKPGTGPEKPGGGPDKPGTTGPEKPGGGPEKPGTTGPEKPGTDGKKPGGGPEKPGEPKAPSKRSKIKEAGLPANGEVRYVPPKGWKPTTPLPKSDGGYIDAAGRIWKKGPNHHFPDEIDPDTGQPWAYEWDVQPPRGKKTFDDGSTHKNVSPNGTIR